MRKVFSTLFITVDGVVESPDEWSFDHFDEDMFALLQSAIDRSDAALLGRVTYEEWAEYWPTATDEPFASFINNTPKYVATTRKLAEPTWAHTTVVDGDLADAVTKLKQQEGKDITIPGSPGLVRSLLARDLLDELTLTVHPVLAGKGGRLFAENADLKRLRLTGVDQTSTGVAVLTYERHP